MGSAYRPSSKTKKNNIKTHKPKNYKHTINTQATNKPKNKHNEKQ